MTNHSGAIKIHLRKSVQEQDFDFRVHYTNKDYATSVIMGINMSSDSFPVGFTEDWQFNSRFVSTDTLGNNANLRFLEFEDAIVVFGALGDINNINETVFNNFTNICNLLRKKAFSVLVKSWNFIPDINRRDSTGLENYQAFCKGRALAFENAGITNFQMPAATGVGSYSNSICGYLVAVKEPNYKNLENSLQISAYKYPPKYGPQSPSFARATIRAGEEKEAKNDCARIFISGTASIRGHQTLWQENIEKQVHTTMENIAHLISYENIDRHNFDQEVLPAELSDIDHFKVYFRRSEDKEKIERLLINQWHIDPNKLFFMHVDICRADLLVEIEGVVNGAG